MSFDFFDAAITVTDTAFITLNEANGSNPGFLVDPPEIPSHAGMFAGIGKTDKDSERPSGSLQ